VASKINGPDGRAAPVSGGSAVKPGREGGGQPASRSESTDRVRITDSARQLAALEQALRELPAVDQGRVDEVSRALAEGRYAVRPERIAEKLLQLEHALRRPSDEK
jgi:flagellar biosynthesis anti-sigma factor FlgM